MVVRRPPCAQAAMCDAGVVVLLFLAGLVPFSSLLFLLLALLVLTSCVQYNAVIQQEVQHLPQQDSQPQSRQQAEAWQHAAVLSMMGTMSLHSPAFHHLRLAMLNREFTDAGKVQCRVLNSVCIQLHLALQHPCIRARAVRLATHCASNPCCSAQQSCRLDMVVHHSARTNNSGQACNLICRLRDAASAGSARPAWTPAAPSI